MSQVKQKVKFLLGVLSEAAGATKDQALADRIQMCVRLFEPAPKKTPRLEEQPHGLQLTLALEIKKRLGPSVKRRGSKRWAKYDFKLVEEARQIRYANPDDPFSYQEIADVINKKHGTSVHWVTIRDWTQSYYRVIR